ncbi:ribonuclease P protein component 1 [Halobacteriales archaeon Cl-PHB]
MARTAATLRRHELVGLDATVTAATNPDLVGVGGRVVGETTNTLTVEGEGRVRQVPKDAATVSFDLESDDGSRTTVTVDGDRLVARPARRTENTGDSTWR